MSEDDALHAYERAHATVVWPMLYLLIGYSWSSSEDDDTAMLHAALVALLCAWIVAFSCANDPKMSLYILASIVGTTVACMVLHTKRSCVLALLPLLSWCLIALLLNWELLSTRAA